MLFKNKSEFRKLFEVYYNPLCNFAAHYCTDNNIQEEDLVQEVFLHLWNNRSTLSIPEDMKSYLFRAVKNKAVEKLRQKKSYEQMIQHFSELSAEEDQRAERLMKMERINSSLRHLPPKCRQVFTMHKFNGLTYAEIAEELDISIKTVENHMLKAIKLLREHLAN